MSFLSPAVLGGLAAVGVPVVIHLLNKFRVRTTDWGAMRFLNDIVQQNQKRIKMDDLILLILRCVLVALAVFAFARPVLKGFGIGGDNQGAVAAAILLDNSASMSQTGGAANRFDLAKAQIRGWLGKQDPQSQVALYLVSTRTTPLIGKPASDFGLFRKSLDDASISDDGSDLLQGLRLAAESLKSITGRPKEIRIYTDGQASAVRNRDELKKLAQENPDIVIRTIVVGGKCEDNLGLVTLRPDGRIVSVGQPSRFRVEVLNSGTEAVRGFKVDLTLDDNSPAGSATIPMIGAGETQGITIPVSFTAAGPHRITAKIPVDAFAADNQRTAAVDVISRMDVVIAGAEASDQGGFFLSKALVPVAPDQSARYYLAPQMVRTADLTASLSQPASERPTAVFLCDPGPIPPAVATALDAYVKQGGNLAVFPGERSDVTAWNADAIFSKLLPATLSPAAEPNPDQAPKSWQNNAFTHSITTFWNDPANGSLGTVKFTRFCPMKLKTAGSPEVIAAFSDGAPSVAEWKVGAGSVVLFNASLSQTWTNLPLHPSFVPLVQRLMGFFNRGNETRLNLAPGQTFRKPMPENLRGKDFSIKRPGADAARTAGQVTEDGIRYSGTDRVGAYQITTGTDPVAIFAVQMDPAESDLRSADAAAFEDLTNIPRTSAAGGDARLVVLKEFWPALMWGLLAIFVVEAALAHRNSFAR